jgi:transposase
MIAAIRRGDSVRMVARRYGVGLATVHRWVQRAAGQRLDRVDLSNQPRGCRRAVNRTEASMEELVLAVRSELQVHSDLGAWGAEAIHRELGHREVAGVPSVRTIGRILARRGAVERRYRLRRPAPPRGWYLPAVASGRVELDSFDIVEGLAIRRGPAFELFNGISLHGALADTHVRAPGFNARTVLTACLVHWQRHGVPAYAQFDNDSRFQGPHSHADVISRVMRLCLALGVTPVFVPPRETGFQAAIESFNGLWQAKVWRRFQFASLPEVQTQTERFLAARIVQLAPRIADAPPRRGLSSDWHPDLQQAPRGQIVFLRRTNDRGQVDLLGHSFVADRHWQHRLVRCTVDLSVGLIHFHALSRREPTAQPLIGQASYEMRPGRFHE